MGYRTKSYRGRAVYSPRTGKPIRYPTAPTKSTLPRTMFGEPQYQYLADVVSLTSIPEARNSVIALRKLYAGANTRTKRLRIMRATVLAANRANVMAHNMRVGTDKRREKARISRIYRRLANKMKADYQYRYHGGPRRHPKLEARLM